MELRWNCMCWFNKGGFEWITYQGVWSLDPSRFSFVLLTRRKACIFIYKNKTDLYHSNSKGIF